MTEHITHPPIPKRKPNIPLKFFLVNEDLKNFIKGNEEEVRHFYKDTEGKITIGYGQVIPNVETAKELPLFLFEGENPARRATQQEIEEAYYKVEARPFGQNIPASYFDPLGPKANLPNIGLQKPDMEFLLETTLRKNITRLQKEFPVFHTYSPGPRKALVDLEYNLGPNKFVRTNIDSKTGQEKGWPKLFDAMVRQDWETASIQSSRKNKGLEGRNEKTKKAFLEGLREKKQKR